MKPDTEYQEEMMRRMNTENTEIMIRSLAFIVVAATVCFICIGWFILNR